MELGGFMDDGLFEETRDRHQRSLPVSYNAKICEPQWFENASDEDPSEKMQLHKYRAEWAYRSQDYRKALEHYQITLDLLSPSNVTMRRDILESVTRCHLRLGRPEDALTTAQQLAAICPSFDQQTAHLNLTAAVYRDLHRHRDELLTLQKCLWLHPVNCDLWVRLAEVYAALLTPPTPAERGDAGVVRKESGQRSPSTEAPLKSSGLMLKEKSMDLSNDSSHDPTNENTEDTEKGSKLRHEKEALAAQDSEIRTDTSVETDSDLRLGMASLSVNGKVGQCGGPSCLGDREGDAMGFEVSTGMEPRRVICTCLMRARVLSSVRKHPDFVIQRYKKISDAMTESIEKLQFEEEVLNKCSEVVTQGIYGDDGPPVEDNSRLVEQINAPSFPAAFERQWFSWS